MKNQDTRATKPPVVDQSTMWVFTADLSDVWDCRCELEQLHDCVTALHLLALDYLKADAMPISTLLCVLANKLEECQGLLSKTLAQAMEGKS